jgi:chitodextrinase
MHTTLPRATARRLVALAAGTLAVLAGLILPSGTALAATALPTPGTPVVAQLTTTSARFTWTPSSGPVANYTVQVIDGNLVPWHDLATTTSTSFTHTGLTPDTVYIYRVIANPRAGSGYAASQPSQPLYVTTLPLPDSQPPTKPGTPRAYTVSTIAATITFDSSTDNNRVAGYWVQRQVNGVWTDWSTNNITTVYLRDLTPNTSYTVVVVAFDPNGNRSVRSDPLTFSTRAIQPSPTCRVQLIAFGTQYQANVSFENMTAATVLANWTVTFTLPANHTVLYSFNATITRVGNQATATPAWYNATIGPGGSASFGFSATYPAGSPLPSGFVLNGAGAAFPCTT